MKKIVTFLVLCILSLLFYSVKIEPYRLKVNEIELLDNDVSFKVVHFTDTHIKKDYKVKDLDKITNLINEANADFIVFTGDLYDHYLSYNDDNNLIALLTKLEANIAKIAIWGNHDYGGGAENVYQSIMEESGFNLIKNTNEIYTLDDGKRILFTGIDDTMLGNPKTTTIDDLSYDYALFLTHEPDVIDNYSLDNYNMILAGHTHGGQIDIPFLPFINDMILKIASFSSKYDAGLNKLEQEQYLYISTGLGTTKLSLRFNVVPEISIINIK